VAKLNASGSNLSYATFLGGTGNERHGFGLGVDAAGNAYVTGTTYSTDFPTTPGAFDSSPNGQSDSFLAMVNTDGSALDYSTYLGGSSYDNGLGLTLDVNGNAYLSGSTSSTNFPTTPGALKRRLRAGESGDAYVTKFAAV
jgi:hypothetical protein